MLSLSYVIDSLPYILTTNVLSITKIMIMILNKRESRDILLPNIVIGLT